MSVPNGVGAGGGLPVAAAWHCENIGPRQRARRIRIGTALLSLGALLAAALFVLHTGRVPRTVVFVPFVAGFITLMQVRARTCVILAARGMKNMDQGEVPVTDQRELLELVRQSRMVKLQGLGLAIVFTLAVLVPS